MLKDPKKRDLVAELARQELARRKAENPLKYFIPNGAQERLVRAVGDAKYDIYLLTAANSVGKSAVTINILGNIIWGAQSEWFDGARFNLPWPYPKKFWYISEQSTLKDFICGVDSGSESEIRKWFIPGRYEFAKSGLEFYSRLTTDNGWVGTFKTYDQDVGKFESDKIGVAVFDEPPPKAIYNAVTARLTMGGIIIMPMTPLFTSAWVQDEIYDKAASDSKIYVFTADIEENCRVHGKNGILDHDQIERIIARYDKDELDARAKGLFMHLSGLIYRGIHPAVHRPETGRRAKDYSQDEYRILCVCDPHDARPPMIGWFAVDRWENVTAIDEFPHQPEFAPFHEIKNWSMTTPEVVKRLRDRERANGWDKPNKIVRVMDPNFGVKPIQAIGKTIKESYAHAGRQINYPMQFSTRVLDDIAAGHQLVRDMLSINADNDTRLRFLPECRNLWHSMTHYGWKPVSSKKMETDGQSEFVAHRYKDGADVVRYAIAYLRKPDIREEVKPIVTYDDYTQRIILPRIRKRALKQQKSWAQI